MSKERPLVFGSPDMRADDLYLIARRHESILDPREVEVLEAARRELAAHHEARRPVYRMLHE
ncbi:hypothetical protein [Roseococcus pinisoli]|uniref:Uncharacterized protein n=1 Tax=Roseococcus pinisoli TaxID=2835040 RepID=A0ABS5QFX2_9PROT|nr:hypothetical protein [Roseococcus pinisoli]MBS7812398.1 hypothetical protein [Roseococcus pinisoli]